MCLKKKVLAKFSHLRLIQFTLMVFTLELCSDSGG